MQIYLSHLMASHDIVSSRDWFEDRLGLRFSERRYDGGRYVSYVAMTEDENLKVSIHSYRYVHGERRMPLPVEYEFDDPVVAIRIQRIIHPIFDFVFANPDLFVMTREPIVMDVDYTVMVGLPPFPPEVMNEFHRV